jgi:Eukaryotic protein of unknown function (DUF842)
VYTYVLTTHMLLLFCLISMDTINSTTHTNNSDIIGGIKRWPFFIFLDWIFCSAMDQDQLNQKLKLAVDDMVKSIQTVRIRPITKKAYLAMAACFDNNSASTQQIDSCVMNSSNYVKACSNIMQSEIGRFEARLQRCAGQCQDSVQDNHPKMDTQSQIDCAQKEMNSCIGQCVGEKHLIDILALRLFQFTGAFLRSDYCSPQKQQQLHHLTTYFNIFSLFR